jgi:hypothetical protein
MRTRSLAFGAAVWTSGYLVAYLAIMQGQNDSPAWWYVAVLATAIALLIPAAAGRPNGAALGLAVLLLTVAVVIGLLSIGILLAPAAVGATVAWTASRRSASGQSVSESESSRR